jgi:non-ribosomal peptide synthetase component F
MWNLLCWHQDFFHVEAGDRHTQVIAPAFDPVAMEMWVMLTIGGSVHICDDETRLSPLEFIKFVEEREISICILPTPIAELILQAEWPSNSPLRILYTGGDKLHSGIFICSYFFHKNHLRCSFFT